MPWNEESTKEMEVETSNNFDHLESECNSMIGVIPFVGAGISAHFGYKTWRTFLMRIAVKVGMETEIDRLIGEGKYEEAASRLKNNDCNIDAEIDNYFSDGMRNSKPLTSGAAGLIPFLAKGAVITTNFDHVLQDVFDVRGRSFNDNVFPASDRSLVWHELKKKEFCLLKLHGDADPTKAANRILTSEDYEEHYERRPELRQLLTDIYLARPVLFLGCSLNGDRTLDILKGVATESLTYHFAIVEAPEDEKQFWVRQRILHNYKIRPIWYPAGRHDRIEQHLGKIVSKLTCLDKIYGPVREVPVVYSHLTMAPELSKYIDDDALCADTGQKSADPGETKKAFFGSEQKRKSIKTYFLVPGDKDGKAFGGEGQQKCRGSKVACVCEVRSTAYLSSKFARTDFIQALILADHELEDRELRLGAPDQPKYESRIYLGIVSNPPSWAILNDKNSLVKLEGLKIDEKCDPYFALATGQRLTPSRPQGTKENSTVDYGIIFRMYSSGIRKIVCAGLGEFGTSGAAYFLASRFETIAPHLTSSETNFFCLVQVPYELDRKAEMVHIPLEQGKDVKVWFSAFQEQMLKLSAAPH